MFVMDEVAGAMLGLLGSPKTVPVYVAGFLLFRLFDVWKPWPIGRIEQFKGPWTIVGDDLAAGVATNLALHALVPFLAGMP
jgi:phosphatidylglycerophosphatase A